MTLVLTLTVDVVSRCWQMQLGGDVRTKGSKADQTAHKKAALGLRDPLTAALRSMMASAIERAESA